jgi:HAD superfamily hydrolase (TIGR01549 family)
LEKKAIFSAASVDVICFDLSETLVAWNHAYDLSLREAASEWAGRWSESADHPNWQETLSSTYWKSRKQGSGRMDAIRNALGVLPIDADERVIVQVARAARLLQPLRCDYIPGAEAALAQLSAKYRLAVLTNLDEARAKQVWRQLGLYRFMMENDLFCASNIGRKPSLRFYRNAAARLGTTAERCLMVGDSYRNDYIGATRAGWKAIWIKKGVRPSARRRRRNERPFIVIPSVGWLPRLFSLTVLIVLLV